MGLGLYAELPGTDDELLEQLPVAHARLLEPAALREHTLTAPLELGALDQLQLAKLLLTGEAHLS